MISGIILKHFKTYKGINYIPISNGSNFCGLIGPNGIGKSSILEALDCFFNNKVWNKNVDANKSDLAYITPIFILEKEFFQKKTNADFAEKYSDAIKAFIDKDIPTTINSQRKILWDSIKEQHNKIDLSNKCIIPIGIDEENNITLNICESEILDKLLSIDGNPDLKDCKEFTKDISPKDIRDEILKRSLREIYSDIISSTTYVYVPKDIEPERFVMFETNEIQNLIGTSLIEVVRKNLPETTIKTLSENLKEFIDTLSNDLPGYKFQMKGARQMNINSKDIYNLIIHDFFAKRELFKENEGKDKNIPLSQLSSGEKQQAMVSFIHSVVTKYRDNTRNLIVAIDEPESALHISLCYEQFEKLYEISCSCCQVIFSSHWYGFIPTITGGCIANITKKEDKHTSLLFNTDKYREEIKHGIELSNGQLPVDVTLKSINDLIQSIISSVLKDDYYNWLICEGSSDRIYLEAYLKEDISNTNLRIVPVCKAKEVKKIYEQLKLAFDDIKTSINGKVFLLIDTDAQFLDFNTEDTQHLQCKRIVNDTDKKTTQLVKNQSNPKSPKTDIEDALNGKIFSKALNHFKQENPILLSFVKNDIEIEEDASYFALSYVSRENDQKMDQFFSENNNENKVLFAKEYVNIMRNGKYKTPVWIDEIKKFFSE